MKLSSKLLYFSIGIFIGITSFYPFQKVRALSGESEEYLQILHEIVSYLETDYVEKVNEPELYKGAIQGILASLKDPHTRFLSKDEYKELQSETRGTFGGLGIEVIFLDGKIVIVSPIDDTPASRAGLMPEDKIIEINGAKTQSMNLNEAIGMMRGEVGTGISLKIERKNQKPFDVDLVREMIKIQYMKTAFIEKEKIGYIRLLQFMGKDTTAKEFAEAVSGFEKKGAKGLVLDFRNNPGGLLDLSVQISELFLESGKEVVSVRGREGKMIRSYKSGNSPNKFLKIPIIILMNNGSASASEIVAGALKDQKRATLLGTKSFGKGSVQNIYNLPHDTAVALTIQKYYTPSGVSIHGKGIEPDFVVEPLTAREEDKFYLEKLAKSGILKEFAKEKPEYNSTNSNEFLNRIKKEKISLPDSFAKFLYFSETMVGKKPALINREFDPQLETAIQKLSNP
ncbi:S41 family peptidase [Leptospira sp. GIMC2001]|uniref:S41 family peptidase n=1 Tax=Leptospira sp. GIMC2001 TaxID=1513297 RepID=UPI00234BB99D|nr:S41 family peptidase [Leptospira sp. GIMC2001]WCL48177.1 S41 family peptidase [Leptospira sp. GIMC2001]